MPNHPHLHLTPPIPPPPLGPPLKPELRLPPAPPPIAHSQQYLLYLAEIGENTAGLVHDMRSPLTVIINGLRLCQHMPLPQIARQRLTLALEEAERLNRIVNDVIAFARSAHPSRSHWQAYHRPDPTRCGVPMPPYQEPSE
ncbi:MAG TPA: histidine kinase dimerization/phospho-acceptor domain-containing protein [Nodosilinea sp.]|nr:histidine kinase dimerization/phospho-acceptor domain-containing protein [Nodosilinea sp.]